MFCVPSLSHVDRRSCVLVLAVLVCCIGSTHLVKKKLHALKNVDQSRQDAVLVSAMLDGPGFHTKMWGRPAYNTPLGPTNLYDTV